LLVCFSPRYGMSVSCISISKQHETAYQR